MRSFSEALEFSGCNGAGGGALGASSTRLREKAFGDAGILLDQASKGPSTHDPSFTIPTIQGHCAVALGASEMGAGSFFSAALFSGFLIFVRFNEVIRGPWDSDW